MNIKCPRCKGTGTIDTDTMDNDDLAQVTEQAQRCPNCGGTLCVMMEPGYAQPLPNVPNAEVVKVPRSSIQNMSCMQCGAEFDPKTLVT